MGSDEQRGGPASAPALRGRGTRAGRGAEAPSSRDKILEVAEGLFARRGFAGVGMREVAEAAGLGKSSLFHYFGGKAQLYLAVLERVLGRIERRLAPALGGPGPAGERLERWTDALIDVLAEDPATPRLLLRALFEDDDFDALSWPEGRRAERRLETILQGVGALLRAGERRGELRETASGHTIQTLIGATVYHFASGSFGAGLLGASLLSGEAVRRRKAEVKALLRHGLAAAGPPPGRATRPG